MINRSVKLVGSTPVGFNEKGASPLYGIKGKELLTPEKYFKLVEVFKPDIYHSIPDSDAVILILTVLRRVFANLWNGIQNCSKMKSALQFTRAVNSSGNHFSSCHSWKDK